MVRMHEYIHRYKQRPSIGVLASFGGKDRSVRSDPLVSSATRVVGVCLDLQNAQDHGPSQDPRTESTGSTISPQCWTLSCLDSLIVGYWAIILGTFH